jgi:hypothetical protein
MEIMERKSPFRARLLARNVEIQYCPDITEVSYNGKNVKVLKMTLLIRPIILLDRAEKCNTMHASQGHRPVAAPVLE